MRLTNEMIELSLSSNEKCFSYQDKYVLLNKELPCKDDMFDEYIKRINMANKSGINTPLILDYYLIPNSQVQGISKGVILEEKACGNVLNIRGMFLYLDRDYDFLQFSNEYLEKINLYLIELEKRSLASIQVYEKLIDDFINLKKYGLVPDANSLNFLYDESIGYSIIDPYFESSGVIKDKDIFKYIINAVYGVTRPVIYLKKNGLNCFYDLPFEYKKRLDEISNMINEKIISAFRNKGFSDDYISESFNENKHRFKTTESYLSNDEFLVELNNWYDSLKLDIDKKI